MNKLGLISDRALTPEDTDRFAHDDFVDQLESLIRSGIDTANIALFGSWGAGKSSISHRLEARFGLPQDHKQYRFVVFNAFKYADTPLLRTFIYRIAQQTVPARADDYRQRLYEHVTRQGFKFPRGSRKILYLATILLIAVTVLFAALLSLLEGEAHAIVLDITHALIPTALPTAVLLTAAATILPVFTSASEQTAPASAEEFEELFLQLVREDIGITGDDDKRLIVFIDELDRCSAREVAGTLETLRTFVNVPGCIFIVAADQHVLEHALTEHVRQSTPQDTVNPYYSAGSGLPR
jgi:uncharacterized membrane protein YidH (DUF202 family)